uniref:Uncharacterized protein n=1 Tax=Hyaloperonospora arabidopsidis (strain Emoy2) TaxID=559515 RepID=M4B8Y8_HYAAE
MVRVPVSSEDAEFHREFQGDEDAQVKIEKNTEASLEDRSTVTKEEKDKGSKDRPVLGRSQVNKVKVEVLEGKSKYHPFVLAGDTLSHDTYHSPVDQKQTVKVEMPKSSKQQKNATFKPKKLQMKAPGDTKSVGPRPSSPGTKSADPELSGPLTWSDTDITMAYH